MKKNIPLLLTIIGFLGLSVIKAQETFDHSHKLLTHVLQSYTIGDTVDYTELKKNPHELLKYLQLTSQISKKEFANWDRNEQLSFLINLYNAYTLKLIIDHYPIDSIKSIGNVFNGPWDQPIVYLFNEKITLEHLEHKIIRKDYSEPRIHFALVCAAKGCPPLRNESFQARILNEQLNSQTTIFLATSHKNRLDLNKNILYLSSIFNWFRSDFEKKETSVQKYVAPFFPPKQKKLLLNKELKIEYTHYDWSLNDKK